MLEVAEVVVDTTIVLLNLLCLLLDLLVELVVEAMAQLVLEDGQMLLKLGHF